MKKRSEKQLTSKELLKKSENAYKRASVKEKLSTLFAFIGVIAAALSLGSGVSAAGVGLAQDALLDKFAQTPQYQIQLKQDTEAALTSENITDSIVELNSNEYQEKVLYACGDEELIKKYNRLKKAGKALLVTFAASAGQMVLSVPEMKITEFSGEKDECRARDYQFEADVLLAERKREDEEKDDDEKDDPIEN